MGGVSGADMICFQEAVDAGLKGTYVAFLSSRVQDLKHIVHRKEDHALPIVNMMVRQKSLIYLLFQTIESM